MRLSDFNKGITYLLTYFQSRDPGIKKTVPGLQTLVIALSTAAAGLCHDAVSDGLLKNCFR